MLDFLIFLYLLAYKISCSAELSMKKFYNFEAWFILTSFLYAKLDLCEHFFS